MNATTHRLAENGWECAYCGAVIPPNASQQALWKPGDKIAVITSPWASPVSYGVGIHDSNPSCQPCSKPL